MNEEKKTFKVIYNIQVYIVYNVYKYQLPKKGEEQMVIGNSLFIMIVNSEQHCFSNVQLVI